MGDREPTKRENLINTCEYAIANNQYLCIEVTIPGQEDTEFIVNKPTSIQNKMEYYCKAYDENLVHCMNDKIKMVNVYSFDKNANVMNIWENN